MERWRGRVALVTGCSSGIGREIARCLMKQGMQVVGCARRMHKLEELGAELGAGFHPFECDVAKETDIKAMFVFIEDIFDRIDVCVNNAGISSLAPLLEAETELWREMFEVNVLAVAACTREAFRLMTRKGIDDGQIVNISSMCGHRIITSDTYYDAFYTVTKQALRALTETTRVELRRMNSHIRIAEISPGLTDTNFHVVQRGEDVAKAGYSRFKCLAAEDIAEMVKYILSAPPHVQVNDILLRATEQMV